MRSPDSPRLGLRRLVETHLTTAAVHEPILDLVVVDLAVVQVRQRNTALARKKRILMAV